MVTIRERVPITITLNREGAMRMRVLDAIEAYVKPLEPAECVRVLRLVLEDVRAVLEGAERDAATGADVAEETGR